MEFDCAKTLQLREMTFLTFPVLSPIRCMGQCIGPLYAMGPLHTCLNYGDLVSKILERCKNSLVNSSVFDSFTSSFWMWVLLFKQEEEKEGLIQETGLELKQVNNWFINQRKRNWHSNPLAASSSADVSMQQRSKRKRLDYIL